MNKIVKSAVTAVLALAVVLSGTAAGAAAAVFPGSPSLQSVTYINTPAGFRPAPPLSTTAGSVSNTVDFTLNDYQSFVKTVEQEFLTRVPEFTVRYNAGRSSTNAALDTLMDDVFAYDDPTTTSDQDYLMWNMNRWSWYKTQSDTYTLVTFKQTYRTTADQENFVNRTVADALQGMNVGASSSFVKITAVQNYILDHVTYDNSLTKYTAYDALKTGQAVCQGYALLAYKMLMELGIPARFIAGTAYPSGENHGWNIVKIGTYWYNLDTTWDDQTTPTRYFLRNNAAFTDHIRFDDYKTTAFNTAYPMSPTDYSNAGVVQTVSLPKTEGSYAVGDVFALKATVAPADAANKSLTWTSSDTAVAAVDGNGTVTIVGPGTAVLVASAADGSGALATFRITARDADVPSAWAKESVNAFIARGVVPSSLSSGYKTNITRAEFTALITNVFEYAKGPYALKSQPPFTDISGSAYRAQISKSYELGIIGGTGPTAFSPDGTLTREQCAKIISAAVGAITGTPVASTAALAFGDAGKIDGWARDFVRYAFEKGLMTGTGANFEPLGTLTREQAMVIAERMIEKYGW